MADLHAALTALSPIQWTDIPHDDLPSFLTSAFAAGELVCNSVPSPPNGEPFETAKPHHTTPNTATSAKEMHPSLARPFPSHQAHEDLHKSWGKPMKFKAEQNPLGVALYKMAGNDRHGAWFARRSVHEGLGFSKFKKAMQREFPHSMAVQGGPGAGAVRGLAGDRRLERQEVKGVGKMEVYQLSAQFPGPVAPRDFMTLLLTTADGLSEKSAAESRDGGGKHVPRHYMIISKPVIHPDGLERSGFVRGKYESVELIREIPLNPSNSSTKSSADPELNPVEWVMITRSDPGGGLPRFLVERGTPEPMLSDVPKFLNWACKVDEVPDPEAVLDEEVQDDSASAQAEEGAAPVPVAINGNGTAQAPPQVQQPSEKSTVESAPMPLPEQQQQHGQGGIMSGMAAAVGAGLDAYAPTAVSQGVHTYLPSTTQEKELAEEVDSSDSSSDSSDANSFRSAEETRHSLAFETPGHAGGATGHARGSSAALSFASNASSTSLSGAKTNTGSDGSGNRKLSSHEKEVLKLAREREKLDRKLAKKRAEEETKMKKSQEKEQSEQDKVKEKHDRDIRKAEAKHKKELEKLERKEEKERKKVEERKGRKDDAAKLSMVCRERDEFRSQLDTFKRENRLLVQRVEELEGENLVMLEKLRGLGGLEAVRDVQEVVEREKGGVKGRVDTEAASSHSSQDLRSQDEGATNVPTALKAPAASVPPTLTCAALATGMKCLPRAKLQMAKGNVLHDWHAEVLAMRGFGRWVVGECAELVKQTGDGGGEEGKWVRWRMKGGGAELRGAGDAGGGRCHEDEVDGLGGNGAEDVLPRRHHAPFALHANVRIHMYVSEAPCGDASMELTMAEQEDATPWPATANAKPPGPTHDAAEAPSVVQQEEDTQLLGRGHFDQLGIVRRKPARPDAPVSWSKSCSDKLALKQVTSLLSGPVSLLCSPAGAHLDTLVLPEERYVKVAIDRAFGKHGRMEGLATEKQESEVEYAFRPFDVKTTRRKFEYAKPLIGSSAEDQDGGGKVVASNLSAFCIDKHPAVMEVIINGVLQGRKQEDPRGASSVSRRKLWDIVRSVAQDIAEKKDFDQEWVEEVIKAESYGSLKAVWMLEERERMKREVKEVALKGWRRNVGDEAWGLT
ncbi:hypothetical protein LTR08_003527 [Meristemomyces frigidus]|nr:hypothetical protein LTR08_003527 [Meristemomyces frigidus]